MNVIIEVQCGICKKTMIPVELGVLEEAQKHGMGFMCDSCYSKEPDRPKRGFGALTPRRAVRSVGI